MDNEKETARRITFIDENQSERTSAIRNEIDSNKLRTKAKASKSLLTSNRKDFSFHVKEA